MRAPTALASRILSTSISPVVICSVVVSLVVCLPIANEASAQQLYDFYPPQGPFFGGLIPDFVNHTITVDQNGDGIVDETFDLPPEIRAEAGTLLQFFLSPTQEVLYSIRSPQPTVVCNNNDQFVEIFFHRLVVSPGNNSTTQLTTGSACLRRPISGGPYFFDPDRNATVRTAFVVAAPQNGQQNVLFVDLVNGGSAIDALNYNANVNLVGGFQVSPAGNALYVEHDSIIPKWRVVDLCADRVGAVGSASTNTNGGTVDAQLVVDGSNLFTRVTNTPALGTPTVVNVPMNNCFGAQPPQLQPLDVQLSGGGSGAVSSSPAGIVCGASCSADFLENTLVTLNAFVLPPSSFSGWGGDCSSAGTNFQATVLMDQARSCTATFLGPQLEVTKTGPAQAAAGVDFDYTLTYSNTGDGPASNVIVRDTLPAGTTFVNASNGGGFGGGVVTWNLGNVSAGQSAQLTLTANSCQAGSVTNDTYSISAQGLGAVAGAPSVVTNVSGGPAPGDISASVSTVQSASPLLPGGTITHTITLVNNTASLIPGLRFSFNTGPGVTIDQFVDAGGGAFTKISPVSASWTGDLAASATVDLVVRVLVDDCLNASSNQLNFGNQIQIVSACGTPLVSIPITVTTDLQRPVEVSTAVRNLPAAQPATPLFLEVTTMRPSDALEVEFSVTNRSQQTQQNITARLPIPAGLEAAMDPPFLAPTDLGAQWDAALEELTWTGSLAVGQTAVVTVALRQSTDVSCRSSFVVTGSVGTCNNLFSSTQVLRFGELPQSPYLQGIDGFSGLYVWEPGADLGWREMLCFQPEVSMSIQEGRPGEVWVGGLPAYVAEPGPGTMSFQSVTFPTAPTHSRDIAWLEASGEALFTSQSDLVAKTHPAGAERTVASGLPFHWAIETTPSGDVLTTTAIGLDRHDAGTGALLQTYLDPTLPLHFQSLVIDTDGDYLSTSFVDDGAGGFLQQLVEVDPVSGAYTVLIADLGALIGVPTDLFGGTYLTSLAIDPTGLLYALLRPSDIVFVIDRSTPSASLLAAQGGTPPTPSPGVFLNDIADLDWIETVEPRVDLEISATAPASAAVGQAANVQVQVTNSAASDATNARLWLSSPVELPLHSPLPSSGSCTSGAAITCDLGPIAAGATLTVDFTVTPQQAGTLHVLAHTNASETEDDASDNVVLVPIVGVATGGFDLDVQITDSADPSSAGQTITYQFTIGNSGPDAASPVLTFDLSNATQLGAIQMPGANCTGIDPVVCTAIAPLAAGGQWSGSIDAAVDSSVLDGSQITATGSVSAPGNELDPSDDSATAITDIANRADLSATIVDDIDPVYPATAVSYEVTITNGGPADDPASLLTLEWSANATLQLASGCTTTPQRAQCPIAVLGGNDSIQTLSLQADGPGPVHVAATIAGSYDPNAANDRASEATATLSANLENMDPDDTGEQLAEGITAGQIDLEPGGQGGPGVEVGTFGLGGWMWGASVGWCSMNCSQAGVCAQSSYAVLNDGYGGLSGFAQCDAGSLSFSCESTGTCGAEVYGVTIGADGLFSGRAWSPDFGWVDFDQPAGSRARTSWTPALFVDGFEAGDTSTWSSSVP